MIIKFIFNFRNFSVIVCLTSLTSCLTKLLPLRMLFSTVINAVFVAKLLILGI